MPVIITTILSMISGMFGPIADWARRKQEMQAAREKAENDYKVQQLETEQADIEASGRRSVQILKSFPSWFRVAVVSMYLYPFVMVQFSKEHALVVIANMGALPDGYNEGVFILVCAMAGIPVGARMVETVFSRVTGYFQSKRDAGYEHEQSMANINRKAIIDSVRHDLGGKIDQKTVDILDRAINKGNDDPSDDVRVG